MLPVSREQALNLLNEKIKTPWVIKHCLATEAIMEGLAERFGEDTEVWKMAGLLHDLDLEIVGEDMTRHGVVTGEILKDLKFPSEIINAILAHNGDVLKIPCRTILDYALTSGESLSGLIVATALVMPSKKLSDVSPQSVIKRMKEKRFAAKVSRERISQAENIGIPFEEFAGICVKSMQKISSDLGL
jgi:putative nucleotidyltransferase with HDIG domain